LTPSHLPRRHFLIAERLPQIAVLDQPAVGRDDALGIEEDRAVIGVPTGNALEEALPVRLLAPRASSTRRRVSGGQGPFREEAASP
jgi:hypothetical protein